MILLQAQIYCGDRITRTFFSETCTNLRFNCEKTAAQGDNVENNKLDSHSIESLGVRSVSAYGAWRRYLHEIQKKVLHTGFIIRIVTIKFSELLSGVLLMRIFDVGSLFSLLEANCFLRRA